MPSTESGVMLNFFSGWPIGPAKIYFGWPAVSFTCPRCYNGFLGAYNNYHINQQELKVSTFSLDVCLAGAVANVADSNRCRCNPKVPSSIPAGGKDFP